MYCRNCGKKVLETDKFCVNCGNAIEVILTNINSKQEQSSVKNNNLPMNWWNFWKYVRFPLGIFLSVINIVAYLPELEVNLITIFAFFIDIAIVAIMCVTYYHFYMHNKIGYKFLLAYLIIELICNCIDSASTYLENYKFTSLVDFAIPFALAFFVYGIVWVVPNYIYFKKRKNCFSVINNTTYNQSEDKDVEELIKKL